MLVGPVWTPNKGVDEPPKWTKVEAPSKLDCVGTTYVSVEGSFSPQVQKTGSSLHMHLLREETYRAAETVAAKPGSAGRPSVGHWPQHERVKELQSRKPQRLLINCQGTGTSHSRT